METIAPITASEARQLLASHDLIAIGVMADDLRQRLHGVKTTFVRVFDMHVDAVPAELPAHVTAGEFRLTGRPSAIASTVAAVRAAGSLATGVPLTGFSLADLQALAAAEDRSLAAVCAALAEAGLHAVAEVAVDGPGATAEAVRVARSAGLSLTRAVVRVLAPDTRLGVAEAARHLQDAVGGFASFAPLPRTLSLTEPTTGYDDVRQVALARLAVTNIRSIQVDWSLYGPKLAQVALTVGADDVDGVAAVEDGLLGVRRSAVEEIRGNIRAAAQQPVERNARFETIGA